MLNPGSEDSWDNVEEGGAKAEAPSASEKALAEVLLLRDTWDADADAKLLQEQVGMLHDQVEKITQLHKERRMAFDKAAESLDVESHALIADAKKRSGVIVQKAEKKTESIRAGAVEETQKWEAEKTALAGAQQFEPLVNLNVGYVRVTRTLTTLNRFPDSMIGCVFSGRHALPKSKDGYFFIDRDGTHFRHILNFLRLSKSYKVEVGGADVRELRRECEYYGIDQLMSPGTEKSLPYKDCSTSNAAMHPADPSSPLCVVELCHLAHLALRRKPAPAQLAAILVGNRPPLAALVSDASSLTRTREVGCCI
ncbi:hypothetical protein B484DRAFT_405582 [Ochromonadaceae sp. CCMP2298]|nr:hypothetical protein B484DRAFT_405582 [Ochromonadaceae sp. CCMP2298]